MSASGVRIIADTQGAGLRALASRVAKMKPRVMVGVPAGKVEPDGTFTALVAAVHEFGAPSRGIPERSFLRSGIHENLPAFGSLSRGLLVRIAEGTMDEGHALGMLGAAAAGKVKEKIVHGPFTPNTAATIKAKGSDRPLIDTGALRQSITYVVEPGGAP